MSKELNVGNIVFVLDAKTNRVDMKSVVNSSVYIILLRKQVQTTLPPVNTESLKNGKPITNDNACNDVSKIGK